MHLPLDIFLALRYLRPKRTFVSFITLLSILGPTLGVAILLIVNSIMAGFGKDIQENIMSWQAHLHVFPNMKSTMDDPEKIIAILEKHGVKASPLIQDSALIQVKASTLSGETEQVIQPKVVYGIDPAREGEVTGIKGAMIYGKFDIEEGEALVGDRLANAVGLGSRKTSNGTKTGRSMSASRTKSICRRKSKSSESSPWASRNSMKMSFSSAATRPPIYSDMTGGQLLPYREKFPIPCRWTN